MKVIHFLFLSFISNSKPDESDVITTIKILTDSITDRTKLNYLISLYDSSVWCDLADLSLTWLAIQLLTPELFLLAPSKVTESPG